MNQRPTGTFEFLKVVKIRSSKLTRDTVRATKIKPEVKDGTEIREFTAKADHIGGG